MYMLNPLPYQEWKNSKYADELDKAPPEEFSFSRLFKNPSKPTEKELKLGTELYEKGAIFPDPALFARNDGAKASSSNHRGSVHETYERQDPQGWNERPDDI